MVHGSLAMIASILTFCSSGSVSATRRSFLQPVTPYFSWHEAFSPDAA
jgi:hypothetical protein